MNKVFLIGRLTNDTELATTNSGINYCRFSLAVSRPLSKENETDFFNIVAWRGLADNCGKYLKKGSQCAVVGALQNRSYTDKDNTKHYITEVIANEVEFLSTANSQKTSVKPTQPNLTPIQDDSPPF